MIMGVIIDMLTSVSTDGLSAEQRSEFWRQVMSDTFVPLTVSQLPAHRFRGCIQANWIGRLMIAEVQSSAHELRRTPRLIQQADAEYFQVALVAGGAARVEQDEREAVLMPGDFAVYETTRPFRWTLDQDVDAWVLTFPRDAVRLSEGQRRLMTARRLPGQAGLTGVVSRFLLDLARHQGSLSLGQAERVVQQSTD